LSAYRLGNHKRQTAYGESYINRFLDTGSIPVISTNKREAALVAASLLLVEMTDARAHGALAHTGKFAGANLLRIAAAIRSSLH